MNNIPSNTLNRLYEVLQRCGSFDKDHTIRTLFVDERISMWRDRLPYADSSDKQVKSTVDFLRDQYNDDKKNALVLLLKVLGDRTHPNDLCHKECTELANELELMLAKQKTKGNVTQVDSPQKSITQGPLFKIITVVIVLIPVVMVINRFLTPKPDVKPIPDITSTIPSATELPLPQEKKITATTIPPLPSATIISPIGVLFDEEPPPLDVMVVIDNSCSMFARRTKGCETAAQSGSDSDFFRVHGTSSFIARLGFGEESEAEYRLGAISLGDAPKLLSELQPLNENRDILIQSITNPAPQLATRIVPAIQLAYDELYRSSDDKPFNRQAIVLITDGLPYPDAEISQLKIEKLVENKTDDVSLFIMLLENPLSLTSEYKGYIQFWREIAARYPHVFVYSIKKDEHIAKTYNDIVSQMQNTVSFLKSIQVKLNNPHSIFINKYVEKITLTIIHNDPNVSSKEVTILDPNGVEVLKNDPGVQRLLSADKRIEVISIGPPRLQNDLKQKDWLVMSEASVEVLSDQVGGYGIYILQPEVSFTELNNVYLATEQHDPKRPFQILFYLQDKKEQKIIDPQPIQGYITFPQGEKKTLRIPSSLSPDKQGVYEINFYFRNEAPELCETSRFTFNLNAGMVEDQSEERIPIAKTDIYVDVAPLVRCTPTPIPTLTPAPTPSPEEEIIVFVKGVTVFGAVICCLLPSVIVGVLIIRRRQRKNMEQKEIMTETELADKQILDQLKEDGSDLSKPHELEFFLYFPNRDLADMAGSKISEQGFEVEISPVVEGTDWECLAKKTVVPEYETVVNISKNLETVVQSLGGEYDGWGTLVVQ